MKPRVLFCASEAVPFAKTGGLADVAGSLPAALARLGCKVTLIIPFYRAAAESGLEFKSTGRRVDVPLGRRIISSEILKSGSGPVETCLVRCDEYFDRTYLYGTPEGDYFDNLERFAFFSRAVVEATLALGPRPQVIHTNDWQTGLVAAYLKNLYSTDRRLSRTATVFTIHNVAYQGRFPGAFFDILGLGPEVFTPEGIEFWGDVNLLKAGVVYSDVITTVSPGYAREIQTAEFGCGLEGLFQKRKKDLYGIPNGVDYDEWDPSKDSHLPANYSAQDMKGKEECRRALLKRFGMRARSTTAVVGMVTRLVAQKGIDLVIEAMPSLMKMDLRLVILGRGDRSYEEALARLAARYKGRLAVETTFDDDLAHLIEAGSDIYLMPSRYEPCGLNQIYSLRYGTIPLVRATGGLNDTVRDYPQRGATGFKFAEYSAPALVRRMREALSVFRDRNMWLQLQKNAMGEDFSWDNSAMRYIELYERAIGGHSSGGRTRRRRRRTRSRGT